LLLSRNFCVPVARDRRRNCRRLGAAARQREAGTVRDSLRKEGQFRPAGVRRLTRSLGSGSLLRHFRRAGS